MTNFILFYLSITAYFVMTTYMDMRDSKHICITTDILVSESFDKKKHLKNRNKIVQFLQTSLIQFKL